MRGESEAAFRAEMARREADELLGTGREKITAAVLRRANESLDRCAVGLRVLQVCCGDIHPPLQVVPAFRDVSIALEEKEAAIERGPGLPVPDQGRGPRQAAAQVLAAEGFLSIEPGGPRPRHRGSSTWPRGLWAAPQVTAARLYLQTMELALSGKRKVIVDAAHSGRRALYLGRKGLELPGNLPPAARWARRW